MINGKIELDFETADRITILNLRNCLDYLESENKELLGLEKLGDHHLVDIGYNSKMITYIIEVLKYFGEDVLR